MIKFIKEKSVPHNVSQTDTEINVHTHSNDHTVSSVAQHCGGAKGIQNNDSNEHLSPDDTEVVSMDLVQCEESVDSGQETDILKEDEDTRLSVARSLVENLLKIREILSSNYKKNEKVLEMNPPPPSDSSIMSTSFYDGDQVEEEEEEYEEQTVSGSVPGRDMVPVVGGEESDSNSDQPDNVSSKWITWRNSQM